MHSPKTIFTISLALLLFAAQLLTTNVPATNAYDTGDAQANSFNITARTPESVPGRLLVKYRKGVSSLQKSNLMRAAGARKDREIPKLGVHVVDLPEGTDQTAYAQILKSHPEVEFAEPDYLLYPCDEMIPDDPLYSSQWHLPAIGCPTAWGMTTGSQQITIALCDTGVDSTHPDLAPNLVPGWNVVDDNSDTSPVAPHGTWTAGTAAAAGNNELGVASPALNCRIMPVRVSSLPSGAALQSDLAAGVVWAADHGARVASVSYAGGGNSTMTDAGSYIQSKGGVLVMAAGNTGTYNSVPDTSDIIITSATDSTDHLAGFSTTGTHIDLAAPGVGILTTAPGNTYQAVNGTSFSTPLVAGAIGLMMSLDPTLTPAQIDTILKVSTDDLGPAGWDSGFGWGRLNVGRAINTVQALFTGGPDTLSPAVGFAQPQIGGPDTGLVGISGGELVHINALDDRGVTQVSLFADGIPLGNVTSSPYEFTWNTSSFADGSQHTLMAVANDQAGNTKTISTAVTLRTGFDATPPLISFAQPQANGQIAVSPEELVQINASDNQSLTGVTLFADGQYMGTIDAAPYVFTWDTSLLVIGSQYTLIAIVQDPSGNSAITSITVTAIPPRDVTPPSVSFQQPQAGSTVTPSAGELVIVNASDNVGVARVSLYSDGVLIGADSSSPYTFKWNTSSLAPGSHTLKAIAFDQMSNSKETTININVAPPRDTKPPTVSFQQPLGGGSVGESTGEQILISASDNVGVASVAFYVDGSLVGNDTSAPYSFLWNTMSLAVGSRHTLKAVAADQQGNSTNVSITVAIKDTIAPQLTFISPSNGATVKGIVTVSTNATDNVGVTRVDFYVDNKMETSVSRAPYSMKWNTDKATKGSHTLKCIAFDQAGNSASTSISVTK